MADRQITEGTTVIVNGKKFTIADPEPVEFGGEHFVVVTSDRSEDTSMVNVRHIVAIQLPSEDD